MNKTLQYRMSYGANQSISGQKLIICVQLGTTTFKDAVQNAPSLRSQVYRGTTENEYIFRVKITYKVLNDLDL